MASQAAGERRVKGGPSGMGVTLAVVTLVLLGGGIFAGLRLFEWERPTIELKGEVALLGQKTKVVAVISDQRSGLREIRAIVRQGQKEAVVATRELGRASLLSRGEPSLEETIEIDTKAQGLTDGPAELVILARDFSWFNWLRGNQTHVSRAVVFDTKAPRLRLVDAPTNKIKPGSSGIVIYGASEEVLGSGVTIDGIFHPGFPVPTRKDGVYGAMIAIPHDTEAVKSVAISGHDRAGNQASLPFALNLRPAPKKTDTITLSDSFLNTKVPEFAQYYPEMKGSLIEQFLYVNNEVRRQNADRIKEVCAQTDPERHWQGRFLRMDRGAPLAGFAQYRTYMYQGEAIDNQVHLGVDLASLRRSEVKAANSGKVVFADYLGIYGNMVMIDHGQGVFSLYAHLSEIRAKVGDLVKTEDLIGLTGTTGMAGGDHLHFAMLINGVMVTPVEWWDEHWIKDNVLLFLQDTNSTPDPKPSPQP